MSTDLLTALAFGIEAVFWLGAYIMIARRGFIDKIYGMPIVAMCANISWEFLFGAGFFSACPEAWAACPPALVQTGTFGAALLDVIIVYTILKYGREQFTLPVMRQYFPYIVLGGIFIAFTVLHPTIASFYTVENGVYTPISVQGGGYTGYGMALMMGVLFIAMFYARGNMAGQSFYIALFMAMGNVFAYLFNYFVFAGNVPIVITVLAFWTAVFNFTYVYLTYTKCQEMGINPWQHI